MAKMPVVPEDYLNADSADARVERDVGALDTAGMASAPALPSTGPQPGSSSLRAAEYAQAHANSRSLGRCYRYVKRALQGSGAVPDYMPGEAAKDAGAELAKRGYTNVLSDPNAGTKSPYDAPAGSVLVYDSPPAALADRLDHNARYGHIEIRTPDGFASDYYRPKAVTGDASNGLSNGKRRLIGVYVNPR